MTNDVDEAFCLYLWRSADVPGILYLARGIESARSVYTELIEDGYIVRAVHLASDTEYEMREGALIPAPQCSGEAPA